MNKLKTKKCCAKAYKSMAIFATIGLFFLAGYFLHAKPSVTIAVAKPSYLFVQTAQNGTLVEENAEQKLYKLTVDDVDPEMSYFTDQPLRRTGVMTVQKFVSLWKNNKTDDVQAKPNVALHGIDPVTQKRFNRIFELSQPKYDAKAKTISYQAKLLGKQKLAKSDLKMAHTLIFIDDLDWGGNCIDKYCPPL